MIIFDKVYEFDYRAEWSEEGEQKTQYFEQLLKSNKRKSVIREVYDQDEQLKKYRNTILKIIKSFYEKVYSTSKIMDDKDSFFLLIFPN